MNASTEVNSRNAILEAVRSNRPAGDYPLPVLPLFPLEHDGTLIEFFSKNLLTMGGKFHDGGKASLDSILTALFPNHGKVASAANEFRGDVDLSTVEPSALEDVDIAVIRASFAVAETGSVLLTDADLKVNSLAYLAQHSIILLDPEDIVLTMQEAYLRPELHEHAYCAFNTGPSATADIEGVLIHGAQGVRSLTVVPRAREAAI